MLLLKGLLLPLLCFLLFYLVLGFEFSWAKSMRLLSIEFGVKLFFTLAMLQKELIC